MELICVNGPNRPGFRFIPHIFRYLDIRLLKPLRVGVAAVAVIKVTGYRRLRMLVDEEGATAQALGRVRIEVLKVFPGVPASGFQAHQQCGLFV